MAFALPANLASPLTESEASADALYRAVLAFDHADEALRLSALTEDIVAEMPGASVKGSDALSLSLPRPSGQRLRARLKQVLSGGLYFCDLVKIGELWKISSWKAKIVWVDGDPAVMAG
ncbi:hypothetical protein SCUP234_07346 [Seiridium cupressi]